MHATQTPKCFLRMGLRAPLGLRHSWKVHLVHHRTCFSVGPRQRGMACWASQGSESQALLPKQQTPSRSRLWGSFIQTLLRHLWYSCGRAHHFLLSSRSLRDHLQQVSQPRRWPAAVPSWLSRAVHCSLLSRPLQDYLVDLCINEQTLRKLPCRPQ